MNPSTPVTLDQDAALASVLRSLRSDFSESFDDETVQTFLTHSYAELASRAKSNNHLPLLAGRFASQRLTALARIEGQHLNGKPVVLFLCTHNSGRSQMALGFFAHHAGDAAIAWSGGSQPAEAINQAVVEAMQERGIDISTEFPKPWTTEVLKAADVVVTMGCGDECPYFPGKRYDDWELDDPAGLPLQAVRPIRDEIERRVLELIASLRRGLRGSMPCWRARGESE